MDTHDATIVGHESADSDTFVVLGHVHNDGPEPNSSEFAANNEEKTLTQKYFKKIAALMPNIDEIHVTGIGQIQEQFIHYLADTPQYKNAIATDSTSNKMSDENLLIFIGKQFY